MSGFKEEFLDHYSRFGLGSMPKADIDALVMHLLEKYGYGDSISFGEAPNQELSERFRTPVSKVKLLRYQAALKFAGGNLDELARKKVVASLKRATYKADKKEIWFSVEDLLAKSWIQGRLKERGEIYDGRFNSEILIVRRKALAHLLKELFSTDDLIQFQIDLAKIESDENLSVVKDKIQSLCEKVLTSVATTVAKVVTAQILT